MSFCYPKGDYIYIIPTVPVSYKLSLCTVFNVNKMTGEMSSGTRVVVNPRQRIDQSIGVFTLLDHDSHQVP